MNGYASRKDAYGGYGPGRLEVSDAHTPKSKALVDGYSKDAMNNFEGDAPRYNPLNTERPQSSALVDLKDPIQVHLLTETALTDSKTFEVLSQEEIDDLKKQIQLLTQRIHQARQNLTIQTKYRDAAVSMSKLYSPGGTERSGDEREAEQERQTIERKCEELASELWSLEKRLIDPQRRLLEHTAGVLQMTHKAANRSNQQNPAVNGIPGSPESMYTFSNGRNSMDPGDELYFDDGRSRGLQVEPPLKSPHREQASQMREENDRLRSQCDDLAAELEALRREDSGRLRSVTETEQRLEGLNRALREVIVKLNPNKYSNYRAPPSGPDASLEPGDTINTQFDYLEQGLKMVQEDEDMESLREAEATAATSSIALARAEIRIDTLNSQLRNMLLETDSNYPRAPDTTGAELDDQFDYSEQALQQIETSLIGSGGAGQAEPTLMSLWDTIQNGYIDIQQRRQERRQTRHGQGLEPDEDDMSGDEGFDLDEPYSLPAFAERVRWLYSEATKLKDQKSVLKRQVKQQRELNNKSDSAKDAELQAKQDELDQIKEMLRASEEEAHKAQEMVSQSMRDVEEAQSAQSLLKERDARIATLESESQAVQQRMADVTSSVSDMEGKMNQADEEIDSLKVQLAEAQAAAAEKQQEAEAMSAQAKEKEQEIERLNGDMIGMKTELTIAQAELDGAYGSRKERAQEVAALKSSAEVQKLNSEVERLKDELASTLKELEGITAETIGAEKEKLDAEGRLDDALAARAGLESEVNELRERLDSEMRGARDQVAKLQEDLDAERLKASSGGAGKPTAGTSMLSEQFRTMMKQERRKFQEDMREEQSKRRKLEEELQKLRRAQGPGKSPLSPR